MMMGGMEARNETGQCMRDSKREGSGSTQRWRRRRMQACAKALTIFPLPVPGSSSQPAVPPLETLLY